MHYYQFNVADYRKDTGHLSLLEHAIYRSLIDSYYLEELPLCADNAKLMRSHSVRTKDEREAFNAVLDDFFILRDDGYHHQRCDEELARIYAKSEKARASAQKRWDKKNAKAMRTHSEGNANGMLPITQYPIPNTKDIDQSEIEQLFDLFWKSGIRKIGKKQANQIFKKLISKKTQKLAFTEYLIKDIKWRLESQQLGFDQIHPATYLRNERWNDERVKPRQTTINNPSLAEQSAEQTTIILAQCEAEEAGFGAMGSDGAVIQAQVDESGRLEAGYQQPINQELYTLVPENGGFK